MPEPKMKLEAGALPYSDGSGDQVRAIVGRTEEGLMLRIEMVHKIKIEEWEVVRNTIEELVKSALSINRAMY